MSVQGDIARSALGWLDLVLPKDKSGPVSRDVRYGPHERQVMDVYQPKGGADGAPILFFFYGGGWHSGTKNDYRFAGHAFAAAGFVTVIADSRIVPEVHYPTFLEDNAKAIDAFVAQSAEFGGDPTRIFLMGHSAGAYNSVMLALDGPTFGLSLAREHIRGVVGLAGPYDFYPFNVKASIDAFAQAEDPERTQPINLVTADAPPIYLGHGTKDMVCGLYNTENMAKAMREAGAEVVERHYDGHKHAAPLLSIFKPLRWICPAFKESLEFMRAR